MLDFSIAESKELEVQLLLDKLKEEFETELRKTKDMAGVKTRGNYAIVSSKTLLETKDRILDTEYYILDAQIKAVLSVINKAKTVAEFRQSITALCENGSVIVSGKKLRLNNNVLETLKDILGIEVVGV